MNEFDGDENEVGGGAGETAVDSRVSMIRAAAYQRYLNRGGMDGDADQDWLEAEAQIDAGKTNDRFPTGDGG